MDEKDISDVRKEIDTLDEQLLELLNKRAELAIQAGRLKESDDRPYYTPEREVEIHRRLQEISDGPLTPSQIRAVFREIISAARSLEKTLDIAYWGPSGTFTHIAAMKGFGTSSNYLSQPSIADVFRAVENRQADYGVVPVENSLAGVVPQTLDMFPQTNVRICAEIYVPIAHHLLSFASSLIDIERVYAGPQPLGQCGNWLRTNLAHAEIVEVVPTSLAAQKAKEDPKAAAIASNLAAKELGMPMLAQHLEDDPHNRTRFLVVGYNEPAPTGNDKTSLMFNLRNRPGELYRALGAFDKNGVNLSMIESRPAQRATFEYIFYADCEGHHTQANLAAAIQGLKALTLECVVLGSYPVAPDADPYE
ncbi:MAG: prephenate dehydratase [Fimbriimonadales bacterium]|nr:prephenate dehydratase [Fimbriimonadales bacterium]